MSTKNLKQNLSQKFKNCNSATIYAEPFDLLQGIGIFYKLNIKKIYVKCDATGEVVKKQYWDDSTKNIANELKEKLIITKGGWYLIGALVLFVLFSIPYAFFQGRIQGENYVAKSNDEKRVLRTALNKGDLVRTTNTIYKIESVNDKTMKITKSSILETDHMNENIDPSKYGNDTFKDTLIISRSSFIRSGMLNQKLEEEFGGEYILQILDNK